MKIRKNNKLKTFLNNEYDKQSVMILNGETKVK